MGRKLKDYFLDMISFGTPQAIVLNLSFILLLPLSYVVFLPINSVFKDFLLPFIFSGDCPDSGLFKNCSFYSTGQARAMSSLLHGDFENAYAMNKLVFLLFFFMLLVLVLNIIKSYKIYRSKGILCGFR